MTSESPISPALQFTSRAYQSCLGLMRLAASPRRPNSADLNLGGQLFYVSELEQARRSLIAAAKIAGAATLAASAQQAVLRQAQRDELIDFLVRSLDEALRILKNEIRKRQPVAVAVSLPPSTIEVEMLERGILPDLVPAETASNSAQQFSAFLAQGARQLTAPDESVSRKLHIWAIPAEYAQKVAAFEAILLEQLPDSDHLNRRWLRLSPRYLGAALRRYRSISCDRQSLAGLIERFGPPVNM